MNRKVDFTLLGGLYVYQDTLDFLQTAYSQSFDALAKSYGDKLILSGVDVVGNNATDGWVIINGEILPFVGGNILANVDVQTIITKEQYDDGLQKDAYFTKRVEFTNLSGFPFTDLKRLPFSASTIQQAFTNVNRLFNSIIHADEAEVIMSGCLVSNVNTSAFTMDVTAGMVMTNGNLIFPQAYSGTYPAYISQDGTWSTALPAGNSIKFDPYTSQRLKDVIRRFNYQTGDLYFSKVLRTHFDAASGLGKWEWLGWKLSDDMAGRVPLGYDRRNNAPGDPVWDVNYNTIWNPGGARTHTLTVGQLPTLTFQYRRTRTDTIGNQYEPNVLASGGGRGLWTGDLVNTNSLGNNEAHPIMQPYRVTAILERL